MCGAKSRYEIFDTRWGPQAKKSNQRKDGRYVSLFILFFRLYRNDDGWDANGRQLTQIDVIFDDIDAIL